MSLICDFVLQIKFVLIGSIIDKIYYFFLFFRLFEAKLKFTVIIVRLDSALEFVLHSRI